MQRLLSQAVWDTDGVRDDLRAYVKELLGTSGAVVAIDETSFPKRGQHSRGTGVPGIRDHERLARVQRPERRTSVLSCP